MLRGHKYFSPDSDEAASGTPDAADASADETTDAKPAETKSSDEESGDKKESKDESKDEEEAPDGEKDEAAPELKDLKLPDGVVVDEQWMAKFVEHPSVSDLTPEKAEGLLGLLGEWLNDNATREQARLEELSSDWAKETESSDLARKVGTKEFSALAAAARSTYFPGLGEVLESVGLTGLGNHPVLAVGLANIAKEHQLLNGNPLSGSPPTAKKAKDTADVLFGDYGRGSNARDDAA